MKKDTMAQVITLSMASGQSIRACIPESVVVGDQILKTEVSQSFALPDNANQPVADSSSEWSRVYWRDATRCGRCGGEVGSAGSQKWVLSDRLCCNDCMGRMLKACGCGGICKDE